jgi:acyl-CoA dehydrogenase
LGAPTLSDTSFLDWPFFTTEHKSFAMELEAWAQSNLSADEPNDVDTACRELVRKLGGAGWLNWCVDGNAIGRPPGLDVRTLCLAREILARHSGLADFAFAMQGLGSGAVSLFGTEAQKAQWLPKVARGDAISAFALSEPEAGSDVAAITMRAARTNDGFRLNGSKTWISNGGIADFYVVFARTGEADGARGLSAFIVPADAPGFHVQSRIEVIAPHPLATLVFDDVCLPENARIGDGGAGFRIAMSVLDTFRSTVGAAALGLARAALELTVQRAKSRKLFGASLGNLQLVQAHIADMAVSIDSAALLVYRAAWAKDNGAPRITREAAMAKLYATEAAQSCADTAVQIWGGLGVTKGQRAESLYREVRALRIYEGASDIQRLVIARQTLG